MTDDYIIYLLLMLAAGYSAEPLVVDPSRRTVRGWDEDRARGGLAVSGMIIELLPDRPAAGRLCSDGGLRAGYVCVCVARRMFVCG